jgi:hypothetical protein
MGPTRRLVADRPAEAHPDGIGRVEPDDAAVLDVDAGHAVARGRDEERMVEADLAGPGPDLAVPVDLAPAQAEMPFADDARRVARRLQHRGERRPAGLDDQVGVAGEDARALAPPGVFAGEERVARGRARRRRRVGVGEAQAPGGQGVDRGRPDLGRAVAADVAVAEIVGVDEDDVRAAGRHALAASGREGGRGGGQSSRADELAPCDVHWLTQCLHNDIFNDFS